MMRSLHKINLSMNFKTLIFLLLLASTYSWGCADPSPELSDRRSAKVGIAMIDWYKENISPMKILTCSYYPSCSQYTKQAIGKYGLVKGWLLGCDRLMRCNHDLWVYREVKHEGELKKYNPVP
ncbi:MAG: putative membrane protein insertion efficiency factor [Chlamydiae bacterium]|nr:putative membrane protein insertion efficiency factor [Chlamydiota bacterium]